MAFSSTMPGEIGFHIVVQCKTSHYLQLNIVWMLNERYIVAILHVPRQYIQLVPPTDLEFIGTLGHLSGSNEQIYTQKATRAKGDQQ